MSTGRKQRPRRLKLLIQLLLLAILALNGIAWMQARAMTHFAVGSQRTPKIEALSMPEKAWTVLTGVNVPKPQNLHTPSDVGLSFETRQISFAENEMLEAWYVPHPQPRGIVLMFPGYATSKEALLAQAVAFNELSYDAFLVDFRGYGGSSGSDTTLGVREAKDVALSVAYVRSIWPGRPIVLYGVSMGSAAVLRAIAAEGVRPDAIVLESPFDRLLTTVSNRFHTMGLPAIPGAQLIIFWGSVQQGFNGFDHNPVDYGQSVECPALLLHGERDPRVSTEQAKAVFDALRGPKEFVEFPSAEHELLIVASPQLWKDHVGQFLTAIKH